MKRKLLIALVAIIAVMGLITAANWHFVSLFVSGPYMGGITESWETSNQTFKLRIDRHSEENAFVGGAYYVFQSASIGSDNWREIFTARHDDPNPIPRENLQFVNPQIGFVFFGPKYAVTTDGGRSWIIRVCNLKSISCIHPLMPSALNLMVAARCVFSPLLISPWISLSCEPLIMVEVGV